MLAITLERRLNRMNIKNRRKTEIKIFMKYGTNMDLAEVMSSAF